jgi:hypothetical protein
MRRLERRLVRQREVDVVTVWFNAWTARENEALEALVRSVLEVLDTNILRRAARNRQLIGGISLAISVIASILGVGRIVDRIWAQVNLDPTKRNEVNDFVRDAMNQWLARVDSAQGRLIVVFVDDLDRCTAPTVMQIFEAIKLYLDAPGFVFVLGWDTEQVLQSVASIRGGEDRLPQRYVEKIVQFGFRVPRPTDEQLSDLVNEYCSQSGITRDVLGAEHRQLLIRTTNANPRQLVRFINRFILLHKLTTAEVDAAALIRLLVLQSSYDSFYRVLLQTEAEQTRNPITEFMDYLDARDAAEQHRFSDLRDVLARYDIDISPDQNVDSSALFTAFERQRPRGFPSLATDHDFVRILRTTSAEERDELWRLARSAEMEASKLAGDQSIAESELRINITSVEPPHSRVLWIDDQPKLEDHALLPRNTELVVARSQSEAERYLRSALSTDGFSLLISDIGRGHEHNAGIVGLSQLRELGYDGPAIFYTSGATVEHQELAEELGAFITESPRELQSLVLSILLREGVDSAVARRAHKASPTGFG